MASCCTVSGYRLAVMSITWTPSEVMASCCTVVGYRLARSGPSNGAQVMASCCTVGGYRLARSGPSNGAQVMASCCTVGGYRLAVMSIKWSPKGSHGFSPSRLLQLEMCFELTLWSKWALSSENNYDRINVLQCEQVKNNQMIK